MALLDRDNFLERFKFNLRWGTLLVEERERSGVTRERLAQMFNLDQSEIARWETGFGSPVAKVFYAVIVHLGAKAHENASKLWFDIQLEYSLNQARQPRTFIALDRLDNGEALGYTDRRGNRFRYADAA